MKRALYKGEGDFHNSPFSAIRLRQHPLLKKDFFKAAPSPRGDFAHAFILIAALRRIIEGKKVPCVFSYSCKARPRLAYEVLNSVVENQTFHSKFS